jgi:hypothetical protein
MDLDGGVIHIEGRLKGWALKSLLFWAPRYGLLPHPNPYVQPHINNRYIGNFMDKRLETRDFRAHSETVYNKKVRSVRGRIKGVEGCEGGELEGENKRGGGGEGLEDRNRCVMNHNAPVHVPKRSVMIHNAPLPPSLLLLHIKSFCKNVVTVHKYCYV